MRSTMFICGLLMFLGTIAFAQEHSDQVTSQSQTNRRVLLRDGVTRPDFSEMQTDAQVVSDPVSIVQENVEEILTVLDRPDYDQNVEQNREDIRQTVLAFTDMDRVSVLVLANYRRDFTSEQFEEFNSLFGRLILSTYINHLEKYSNERVEISGLQESTGGRILRVRVETVVVGAEMEIPVDYSLAFEDKSWSLYDMRVEGVSLVMNYRKQFREILRKGSPTDLLERIREKVEKQDGEQE